MRIRIREALESDAQRINEINRDSWVETYTNSDLGLEKDFLLTRKEITPERVEKTKEYIKKAEAYYVAEVDGIIRGFAAPRIDDKGRNRLGGTYVEPGFTGKGIGRRLIQAVIKFYEGRGDIYLEVADYNDGAIRFYKRYGFEILSNEPEKHWLDEERYIPVITMVRKESWSKKNQEPKGKGKVSTE